MKKWGKVIFRGNQHSQVTGGGLESLEPSMCINNVLLVDDIKSFMFINCNKLKSESIFFSFNYFF